MKMPARLALCAIHAFTLLMWCGPPLSAQTTNQDQRIRLAQAYERGGRPEDALRLYQELYAEDSSNVVFFDGLSRVYLLLKRHEEAIGLIGARLAEHPEDIALKARLGSVLYKAGRESEAFEEWHGAVNSDSLNPSVYRAVATAMVESRLLENAADLYRRAQRTTGKDDLFTLELAQLSVATMNYRGATAQYARWLTTNPAQLSFVQQRMAAIAAKEDGRAEAIAQLRDTPGAGESLPLLELLAWLYLEGKGYDEAHEVYRRIDAISGADGARIYLFAEQAYNEGAYQTAARAYLEAIAAPVSPNRLPAARYGYASCLKEIAVLTDSVQGASMDPDERAGLYQDALDRFDEVIREYPGTEFSARSRFQVGMLLYERFFDLDGSLGALAVVQQELPSATPVFYSVSLKIGEVMTAKGDTAEAAARFRTVMDADGALPDQQDEATFRLAELTYFRGQFKEAAEILGTLTVNLRADYANDALRLRSFLSDNMEGWSDALVGYARADYLSRLRRDTEAVEVLEHVVQQYPRAPLVDDALMLAGGLQTRSGQFLEAIGTYRRMIDEFSETSIAPDLAWYAIGEIYQYRLRDTSAASEAYQKLLSDFPGSLHADEARKRIRILRGEQL